MDNTTEKTHLQDDTKKSDSLSLDTLFGVLSTWHIPLIVFAVIRGFPSSMMLMAVVFAAPEGQQFYCDTPPDWTPLAGECLMQRLDSAVQDGHNASLLTSGRSPEASDTVSCPGWTFDRSIYRGTTLVEEWDLVCSRRWMASSSQSLYIFGLIFSTTIFSHVADWYGRKRACVISLSFSLLVGVLLSCSPSMTIYNVLRFVAAVCSSGYYDSATILLVESVSADKRYVVTLTAGLGWTAGMVFLPVVSYLAPNWRTQQLVVVAPFVLLLILTLFIDESPRWLLEAGHFGDARKILVKVLRYRQKSQPPSIERKENLTLDGLDRLIDDIKTRGATIPQRGKGTVASLFAPQFWRSTLVFSYTKMVAYLLWYHVTISSVSVGLNPYLSFALASLCELPNRAIDAIIVRTAPRRVAAAMAFAITASAMSIYYVFSDGSWIIRLASLVVCRLCMDAHGSVQRVQLAELYPSRLRSLIAGFVYTCANLAGLLSPFINYVGETTFDWVPSVIIVSLCVTGCLATLTVKETFGRDLPEDST